MKHRICFFSLVIGFLIITGCSDENEGKIEELESEIDGLNEEINELTEQLDSRDETISSLETEISELEEEINRLEEEKNKLDEKLNETANGDELRNAADNVVIALENKNFQNLSEYVHPSRGVRFSPYGYVNKDEDLQFSNEEVASFHEDTTEYEWGTQDGSGHTIRLTPEEYYEEYIYIRDFSREAEVIAINEIESYGNVIVNVEEKYEDAQFVSYYVSETEGELNWANLILVFEEEDDNWYLVAIVVDRWTT
ncbi:MAG: hypothetical protein LRY73_16370 [Bacillus sp. (in: Bacteria)]|nr:hypothetical protein [Bacillus sp. (in: firmicutes)]